MQQTLIILKPDAVQKNLIGAVISRFEQTGFKVKNLYALKASKEILESHYETIGKLLTRTNAEIFNEVVRESLINDNIIERTTVKRGIVSRYEEDFKNKDITEKTYKILKKIEKEFSKLGLLDEIV